MSSKKIDPAYELAGFAEVRRRLAPKPKRKTLEQLTHQVERWNAKYPVGRAVMVERDNGTIYTTRTRSRADVLEGHTAVIFVEGIEGCYLLDRVQAVNP